VRVPQLNKNKTSRRGRAGDFAAVLLLLLILAGGGWLWWHSKHPKKNFSRQPIVVNKPISLASIPPPAVPLPPPIKLVEAIPPPALLATNPPPAVVTAPPIRTATNAATSWPAHDIFEVQVALARRAISPGSIDGAIGSQTRAAIAAFQRSQNLPVTGRWDTNTRPQLTLAEPVLTTYVVITNDLERLQPIGKTWLAKSQQSALDYETILELVAEKAHAHPLLIQKLNPGVDWANVPAGTVLKIPDVEYPEPNGKAAFVIIHLAERFLEAFDTDTNLLAHFPCSIGARFDKRPVGELKVKAIAPNPNYTFDPAVFPESPEAQAIGHKLILPPGPNNPVGTAWIGLDKPGYGMHGTPSPEQVGRTESHGCFRLANWDAEYLVKLVWIGLPVEVVP
jgi:lipoprotein-anchoring transpeptidase ErfK/SrfK